MKKIFILVGEPSGDRLASKVISTLKKKSKDIEYLCVGGDHLKKLDIRSIYDLSEVTYLGFTNVIFNLLNIKKKIKFTTDEIIRFNPDILFSIDSPDFTLRIAKKVKTINPKINTVHFVSPKVYVWRKNRVKKLKLFLDHILLLFPFEKKYFEKENIQSTFVGHPLLDDDINSKVDISHFTNNYKKIFSIFPGSRLSEINILAPILFKFIKLMNNKYNDIFFIFHATQSHFNLIKKMLINEGFDNCDVVFDENIKSEVLKKSFFAISKSGTVSLEICNFKIPSVIIYKMNFINFFIIKLLVKVKFANIINITANEEIIPELLQSKCNPENIFHVVDELLSNKNDLQKQITKTQEIIKKFKTNKSTEIASMALINFL